MAEREYDLVDDTPELGPDVEDIYQVEDPRPSFNVNVVGPVNVQELPVRSSSFAKKYCGLGLPPVKLLNKDPKRKRAVILTDQAIRLGGTAGEALSGQTAVWYGGGLTLFGTGELWATADTANASVNVVCEYWAI